MSTPSAGNGKHQDGQETIRLLEQLSADQDFPAFSQVVAQANIKSLRNQITMAMRTPGRN